MKHNMMLTITSLLDPLHDASPDERYRPRQVGTAEAGGSTLVAVPILVVWLYGTLVLAERRSGTSIVTGRVTNKLQVESSRKLDLW
jgi:uncharacterized membrane protein YgcG